MTLLLLAALLQDPEWLTDLEKARELATAEGKPVLVYTYDADH